MTANSPKVVILSGPNGSGKSTCAPRLLRGLMNVSEFVNADSIAQGLSGFAPETVSIAAGRLMLSRIQELAKLRQDFAFETTLASRTFAPWLRELIQSGYEFHLVYLWLPDPDAAVARVAERVRLGGHSVPEETIRRRYRAGAVNFFELYRPLAKRWKVIDNSRTGPSRVIAAGTGDTVDVVKLKQPWQRFLDLSRAD